MKIDEFGVEIWMNRHETSCRYNLAETCVRSLTVGELLALTGKTDEFLGDISPLQLTYGEIPGTERLRTLIAGLYSRQRQENVLVTHGAAGANALVYSTLVEPGDPVVTLVPTYQQHYSIPESLGAQVRRLPLLRSDRFLPDLQALARLVGPGTRMISITNPNNPTGALMDRECLQQIVDIARRHEAWVLCDEVYRGTDQEGDGFTPSIADLYERGISTGSMSKAYSLAGLRLGWIVAPVDLLASVSIHRDYNTISVGMIDDYLASLALEHRAAVLGRSRRITRENLASVEEWLDSQPRVSWVKPRSGTTALLQLEIDRPSAELCTQLLASTGVLLTPGSAMGMEGHVRLGYANSTAILREGLARLGSYLQQPG